MPYATINKPTQHFNTVTYTADDTSPRTLTGFGHQPDFVWVKHRGSGSVSHTLVNPEPVYSITKEALPLSIDHND